MIHKALCFFALFAAFAAFPALGMKDKKPKKQENEMSLPAYKNFNHDGHVYLETSINYLLNLFYQYKNAIGLKNDQKANLILKRWVTSLSSFVATENTMAACGIASQGVNEIQNKCLNLKSCSIGELKQDLELSSLLKPQVLLNDLIATITLIYNEIDYEVNFLNNQNQDLVNPLSDFLEQLKAIEIE